MLRLARMVQSRSKACFSCTRVARRRWKMPRIGSSCEATASPPLTRKALSRSTRPGTLDLRSHTLTERMGPSRREKAGDMPLGR